MRAGPPINRVRLERHYPFSGNNMRKVSTNFHWARYRPGPHSCGLWPTTSPVAIPASIPTTSCSILPAARHRLHLPKCPESVNENFDVSVACESGTLMVSGSITGQRRRGDVHKRSHNDRHSYRSCGRPRRVWFGVELGSERMCGRRRHEYVHDGWSPCGRGRSPPDFYASRSDADWDGDGGI